MTSLAMTSLVMIPFMSSTTKFKHHPSCHLTLHAHNGFTLLEVLIALLILATSMVTILSLQGAIMSRTVQDSRAQRALLASRLILSLIEAQEDTLPFTNDQGTVADIIKVIAPEGGNLPTILNLSDYADIQAAITTQPWTAGGIAENLLKKFVITLKWGDGPGEFLETTYLGTEEFKVDDQP